MSHTLKYSVFVGDSMFK